VIVAVGTCRPAAHDRQSEALFPAPAPCLVENRDPADLNPDLRTFSFSQLFQVSSD
jgi:hypothetical protein